MDSPTFPTWILREKPNGTRHELFYRKYMLCGVFSSSKWWTALTRHGVESFPIALGSTGVLIRKSHWGSNRTYNVFPREEIRRPSNASRPAEWRFSPFCCRTQYLSNHDLVCAWFKVTKSAWSFGSVTVKQRRVSSALRTSSRVFSDVADPVVLKFHTVTHARRFRKTSRWRNRSLLPRATAWNRLLIARPNDLLPIMIIPNARESVTAAHRTFSHTRSSWTES